MEQVHLTNFSIDYDDCSVSFTFGNKYDENDIKSLFDDVFGSVKTSAAAVKYLKNIVNDQRSELDKQRDWIDNDLTLTKNHFLTSNNQSVIIDDSGYWGRRQSTDADGNLIFDTKGNPIYDNEQLRIVNNTIAITKDNWQRIATAIGKIYLYHDDATGEDVYEYGVAGKLLLGDMIIGKTLSLLGSPRADGTYAITLNENGLTIINDGTSAGMTIQDAYGNKQLYADSNGNLHLSAAIVANSGNIAELTLSAGAMFKVNGWAESGAYIGYSSGLNAMYANAPGRDIFLWVGEHRGGDLEYNTPEGFDNAWTEELSAWDWKAVSPHWSMTVQDSIKNSAPFYVTWDGALHASNAYVKGEITATSGNVGGWDIGNGFLRSTYDLNGTKYVGMGLNDVTFAFFAGASNPVGSDGVFRVGHDGSLYAENATIKGDITATSGSVGGWIIDSSRIYNYNADAGYTFSLWNPGIAGGAIISCDKDGVVPFYVSRDGYLHASNADITGTINAGSVLINGVKVGTGQNTYFNDYSSTGTMWGSVVSGGAAIYLYQTGITASGKTISLNAADGGGLGGSGKWVYGGGEIATKSTGSDVRIKHDINSLSYKYDQLFDLLHPVSFIYNQDAYGYGTSQRTHIGFIANEVKKSMDEISLPTKEFAGFVDRSYNSIENDILALAYEEFIALNTWQIQKLKAQIKVLETRISLLEN